MRAPIRLNYGDTLGVIAPASPDDEIKIKSQIQKLTDLGFKIKEGPHLYDRYGFLAGSDKDRAKDLMDMFLDPKIKGIICFRGGYGSMRILPLINFKIIKNNPKIFIGYSDITTLLNQISLKCNLITFHGPMVNSDITEEYTLNSFLSTLMNNTSSYSIRNPLEIPMVASNFCKSKPYPEGTLVGGNLTLICSTLGTRYEIDTKDKILFIEEISETPYKIDRMLTQLLLTRKLQNCKGIILGQFKDCEAKNLDRSLSLSEVIDNRVLSLSIPTFLNFMSGHDMPKLTLPIGAKAKLNYEKMSIDITHGVVK